MASIFEYAERVFLFISDDDDKVLELEAIASVIRKGNEESQETVVFLLMTVRSQKNFGSRLFIKVRSEIDFSMI